MIIIIIFLIVIVVLSCIREGVFYFIVKTKKMKYGGVGMWIHVLYYMSSFLLSINRGSTSEEPTKNKKKMLSIHYPVGLNLITTSEVYLTNTETPSVDSY